MPPSGGTSTTTTTQQLGPEQKQLINLALPKAREYASQDLELFPGSTIAGPNSLQRQGRSDVLGTARGPVRDLSNRSLATAEAFTTSGTQQGLEGVDNLLGAGSLGGAGLGGLLADYASGTPGRRFIESGALLDPASNPVLGMQTEAALRPITTRLTEEVLPGIRSEFVGNNMFGNSRQGIAEGRAVDSFLQEAGDIATGLQMNNFNQGLGAMLSSLNAGRSAATSATGAGLGAGEAGTGQALNSAIQGLSLSPSLAQLSLLPGLTTEGVGRAYQQEEQARLSERANRFMTEQMLPIMQAQDIANLAFGIGGGSSTSTGSQQPGFSPLQTGLGLMMSLPFLFG